MKIDQIDQSDQEAIFSDWKLFFLFYIAYWSTWFHNMIRPSTESLHYLLTHYKSVWYIVNSVGFLREKFLSKVFSCKMYQYKLCIKLSIQIKEMHDWLLS